MKKLLPIFTLLLGYIILSLLAINSETKKLIGLKPYEDLHIIPNYPDFNLEDNSYKIVIKELAKQSKVKRVKTDENQAKWITQEPYNIGVRLNTIAHNPGND